MLKAGVALVDISPWPGIPMAGYPHCPRPNIGIHDPLYCAALYLNNGKEEMVMVTMDLLFFGKKYCRAIREKIGKNIMFTTSHTHSGPWSSTPLASEIAEGCFDDPAYIAELLPKVEACIREAMANPFDAKIGTGIGHCGKEQGIGGNRRDKDGLQDPTVNVIAVKDMEDTVRGVLLNYALHPTYLHAENLYVTADYPGYIRRYIRYAYPEAVFMFAQGTSGNQSSRYFRTGQDFEEAARAGTTLGVEVYHTVESLDFTQDIEIEFKNKELDLPVRSFPPVEEARAEMERARAAFAQMPEDNYIEKRNCELAMFGAENEFYYAELAENSDVRDAELPCEVMTLRLGDTLICGLQGEIFVEYGLELKAASPYAKTFVFEVTNGTLPGYVFTPEAIAEGGYEVGTSIFTGEAGSAIVDGIKSLF